jgi:LacI family transcriptional regulator
MAKVTTTDIAREAGVSQSTVSMVLSFRENVVISEGTRARVQEAAERLGYQKPTVGRRRARSKIGSVLIGLMMPNLNNLFFTNVVSFVERYASLMGYEIVVCNIERKMEREEKKLASLVAKGVDGIIVAYTPHDVGNLKEIGRKMPVVILGESPTNCGIHTIGINGYRCGELMAAHLYELGHRDIAMLTAPIKRISLTRPRRISGARAYLESKGCAEGFYVLEDDDESEADEIYEFTIGYRLARRLLEDGRRFTAIMCSDMSAPGVYNVLSEANLRIPEDVSVVGIDNTFVGRILAPALTTIDHHLRERCKLAVENLVENIQGDDSSPEGYLVEYSPSLIVRSSTAPSGGRVRV